MRILLFIGAGASVELKIPAMRMMVEQFQDHLKEQGFTKDVIKQVDLRIESGGYDMEHLIDELDKIDNGSAASQKWGMAIDKQMAASVGEIRREAEWFVLHVCERIQPRWATQLWLPTLRNMLSHKVTIASTNYDRAVEIAASQLGIRIFDGFEDFGVKEYASWQGFKSEDGIKLLKLHGSTDWFHAENGKSVWKLRHAMPLFGALTLIIDGPVPLGLVSAAVLPSREKKSNLRPYPELSFEFQAVAREAEIAIFLGTSLRDPDVYSVFDSCAARIPTYVVTRGDQYENGIVTESVVILKQTASRFLISTFPNLLRQNSPEKFIQSVSKDENYTESMLEWLVVARNTNRSQADRCAAIEKLADAKIILESQNIEPLIQDADELIRTYSLGLVQDSPDREELVTFAQSVSENDPDSMFAKETQTLIKILAKDNL